ncbi:MAG: chromate transporter, partial [Caulobacteraceae bacterium]|nr:chromate transporter [Caulobacteraceae bacterium]
MSDTLTALFVQFAILSLLAFGGANAVVPEIHRQAVEINHWMSDADFAALFAIAQAAPGPNFMISTLVGLKAAGLAGALVATVAMCAPSCLLAF